MMDAADSKDLLWHLMQADEFGLKLEVVQGDHTWEFFPSPLHQSVIRRIDRSVRPAESYTLSDAYVRFADGSLKRPDLAIYCSEPPLSREPLAVIPEAVVEVLSPGSEKKDLDVGPGFYLSQGVKDVIVVDPETRRVTHFRRDGVLRYDGPVTLILECGCELMA